MTRFAVTGRLELGKFERRIMLRLNRTLMGLSGSAA
jgi:hypothetical protein